MKYTQAHAAKGTDIHEHLPTLHSLVVNSGAKDVLELGVREGESTVALLEGVAATGGHLTSLDITPCEKARAMIESYGLAGRWTFMVEDDLFFAKNQNAGRTWDLIFVDTSHLYEHTKNEIEAFEPLLRPGGHMVFHDTASFPDGVLRPIQEYLGARSGYVFDNRLNCNGLGIVRKP